MAALAGRAGDGMNAPAGRGLDRMIATAREALSAAGRSEEPFIVTASGGGSARERADLERAGVHRVVVYVRPPYVDGVQRVAASL